jgi:hypothetical protein
LKLPFLGALAVACAAALPTAGAVQASAPCGAPGYSYAGLLGKPGISQYGIVASLTTLSPPTVEGGHVAAWVGVGGPYEGPNGTPEWLQVGVNSAKGGSGNHLYYEYARPGSGVTYVDLKTDVPTGTAVRVSVLQAAEGRDDWRVWVNGQAVSGVINLPGSRGRLTPVATAESWDGGTAACNRYSYRFDKVNVASTLAGRWGPFTRSVIRRDVGQVLTGSRVTFVARGGPIQDGTSGVSANGQ